MLYNYLAIFGLLCYSENEEVFRMNLKKYSLIAIGAGVCTLLPVISVFVALMSVPQGPSVGIIGGADGPTAQFLMTELLSDWPGCLFLLAAALILSGFFCLLFSKTVARVCSVKTSAVALGLSATGGVGLYCFFAWLAMTAFHETGKHPIAYPVSVALGVVCLTAFAALLAIYFRKRRQSWSWGGLAIDVATAVLYLPFFTCAVSCMHVWLGA